MLSQFSEIYIRLGQVKTSKYRLDQVSTLDLVRYGYDRLGHVRPG